MIKNGFRYDMGVPYIQNLFRKAATISGIRYGNDVLNIECDTEGNYSISGSYINTPPDHPDKLWRISSRLQRREPKSDKSKQCE